MLNNNDSYATKLLDDSKFNLTVRHTFLEVEESVQGGSLKLRPSRSCGDLPILAEIEELPDQLLIRKDVSSSSVGSSKGTETPSSSSTSKESTQWKDMSDEGEDNSTVSAVGSFTQESHPTGSSTPSQRSGSPTAKRVHPTPAARRRERRRRAANAAGITQAETAKPYLPPGSGPRPAPDNSSRRPRANDGHTDDGETRTVVAAEESFSKGEEGGEVWLQRLWDGAYSAEQILEATYGAIDHLSLVNIVDAFHAMGKCVEGDAVSLGNDERLLALISRLRGRARGLNKPRLVARALWGLGKVAARGEDIANVLVQLAATFTANPGLLESCTSQELTNSLWGLARLGSVDPRCRCHAERLVHRIVAESGTRMPSLTAQCLANSLWAIGKLGMRGQSVSTFASGCLKEMCGQRCLSTFSAQGLANSLWACARLQLFQNEDVTKFCCTVAAQVNSERLSSFLPQELSMTIWAIAKLTGKGSLRGGHGPFGSASRPQRRLKVNSDVEAFVIRATKEAFHRLGEFSPQGLSNIGWALATMELTRQEDVRSFLIAAASKAMSELKWYPPQAIANLCWALCRLNDAADDGTVNMFASAVAVQAQRRMQDFEWQDLAGIISAMNRAELVQLEEVYNFASELVMHAATSEDEAIGTQALLNMALSAARLGVDPDVLRPLADRIDAVFSEEGKEHLNDIDRRQWSEVQSHCLCSMQQNSWADALSLVRQDSYLPEAGRTEYSFFEEHDAQVAAQNMAWASTEAWMTTDSVEAWQPCEFWATSEAWTACNNPHQYQVLVAIF